MAGRISVYVETRPPAILMVSSRSLLRTLALAAAVACSPVTAAQPVTGEVVPSMAHFDAFVLDLMDRQGIHGAALAVVKDERLVYARGFGYANTQLGTPVEPDALFRIGSISKPVTAVVTLRLVEDGRLSLDESAFARLSDLSPVPGRTPDPRLGDITIRDLLQHSGGWDRAISGEPLGKTFEIIDALGLSAPPSCDEIVRFQLGQPLDFDPGARHSYAGFGFCVLEAVIERVTGQDYEAFARSVLAETGIEDMQIGAERREALAPGEVHYYDATTAPSIFDRTQTVPMVYGGFDLVGRRASGGWIASAVDLARFVTSVDSRTRRPDVLAASTVEAMLARPALPTWQGTTSWYGLGWQHNEGGVRFHSGALPGTRAAIVQAADYGWAFVINTTPSNPSTIFPDINQGLFAQVNATTSWPSHDLFSTQNTAAADGGREPGGLDLTVAPNPASRRATLQVSVREAAPVRLVVVDALGREVRVLHDGPLAAGSHAFPLQDLAPAVYVVRARSGGGTRARLLTVAR